MENFSYYLEKKVPHEISPYLGRFPLHSHHEEKSAEVYPILALSLVCIPNSVLLISIVFQLAVFLYLLNENSKIVMVKNVCLAVFKNVILINLLIVNDKGMF